MFWEAPVGSVLIAKHEDDSQSLIYDKLAIALVNNDSVTDGHIPKFVSKLTWFFLKHGGHIKCKITSGQKYLKELEKGGLQIPARLTISNTSKKMADIMKEKLNPLDEKSTEESTVKQKIYSIEYFVYYKLL